MAGQTSNTAPEVWAASHNRSLAADLALTADNLAITASQDIPAEESEDL